MSVLIHTGEIRLNSSLWQELNPAQMTLNATVEQHEAVRPYLDKILGPNGNWSAEDIFDHALKYLDTFLESGNPLKIKNDLGVFQLPYYFNSLLKVTVMYVLVDMKTVRNMFELTTVSIQE